MSALDIDRMAYAETRDALPVPYGGGLTYREDERPATPKQARSVYIACGICILLLIAGFAYIAWASSNGGYRWQ